MARRSIKEWPLSLWAWGAVSLLLLALLSSQLYAIFTVSGEATADSVAAGQRVVYKVATKEMLSRTPPKIPEKKAASEEVMPEEEAPTAEAPADTAEDPADEAATHEADVAEPVAEEAAAEPAATPPEPDAHHEEAAPTPPATGPLWQRNAMGFANPEHQPIIVIVIAQAGLSKSSTETLLEALPPHVTLSFSPYADALADWVSKARAKGHEVMLDLPMEPVDYPLSDPGPLGLLTSNSAEEITQRLDTLRELTEGYVGMMSPMREQFTRRTDISETMLRALQTHELMFLLGQPGDAPEFTELQKSVKAQVLFADVQIDMTPARAAIEAQLAALEAKARERGFAVGVAQPYPVTVDALAGWAEALSTRGVLLAPASAVLRGEWQMPAAATPAATQEESAPVGAVTAK
ncbi:MAG: divergent polysaccharide deacetylase family protein [Alphaproteobacteria bacterium]|nr:divergent polysaccharide deacetylase family protein [Alphaproteobacteria bacterium]